MAGFVIEYISCQNPSTATRPTTTKTIVTHKCLLSIDLSPNP